MDRFSNVPPMPDLGPMPTPFNAFDSGISREEVGKIVVGVLQNVSINGVYPTVSGSNINFPVLDPPAPSQWAQQNWLGLNLSTSTDNIPTSQSNTAVIGYSSGAVQDSKVAAIVSNSQPIADSKVGAANAGATPVYDSKIEVARSIATPISDSKIEASNSRATPVSDSRTETTRSKATPISDSRIEASNSKATPISDSRIEASNSKATPVSDSRTETTRSRATPVSDSNRAADSSKSSPLSDSERVLNDPPSNTLSRRRSNEQAGDTNSVTPLYVRSADGLSAMIVYIQEAHTISVDPSLAVGDVMKDSLSGEGISTNEYFMSGGSSAGTFLASYNKDTGQTSVTGGYYGILNTFTEVGPMKATGGYVYAIIRHSNAGVFESFALEITSSNKDPTNLDGSGKFVQFSNVLLAAVTGDSVTQYRTGNFVLINQAINGKLCLWPYSSGGSM